MWVVHLMFGMVLLATLFSMLSCPPRKKGE